MIIIKMETLFKHRLFILKGNIVVLHLRSFKTPPSSEAMAVMSDEDDADCAFSMRKGV